MPSTFTWLDNSEHDRRRAMEVIYSPLATLFLLGWTSSSGCLMPIENASPDAAQEVSQVAVAANDEEMKGERLSGPCRTATRPKPQG